MELLETVFKSTPILPAALYAVAVFGLFQYVASAASQTTNKIVQGWLSGKPYNSTEVRSVALYAFDRLYGPHLFSVKSLIRSFTISLVITLLVIYQTLYMTFYFIACEECGVGAQFTLQILSNLVIDYVSLFAIRYAIVKIPNAVFAIFIGPLIGLAAIIVGYTIVSVIRLSIQTESFHLRYFYEGAFEWVLFFMNWDFSSRMSIAVGAMVVHTWLPLLAIGVGFARLLNLLRSSALFAQKYVKNGTKQPIIVIGYAVATFVFVTALALNIVIL